jgi:hypothetical protein
MLRLNLLLFHLFIGKFAFELNLRLEFWLFFLFYDGLLLLFQSLLLLLMTDVEVRWQETLLFIAFVDQVVNSCDLVVFIIVNAFLCVVWLKTEFFQHFKDFRLRRDVILPYDQTLILAYRLVKVEPLVLTYLCLCVSLVWVSI